MSRMHAIICLGDKFALKYVLLIHMLIFGVLFCSTCCCFAAPARKPGDAKDVRIPTGSGEQVFKFIFIPAGDVPIGRPGGDDEPKRLEKDYWFAAYEISLSQFMALAPLATQNAFVERVEKLNSSPEQKVILESIQKQHESYVVQMISIEEAAQFTAELNRQFVAHADQSKQTLSQERFRLPTAIEWQHAMSMASMSGESRSINPWPAFPDKFSKNDQVFLEEKWKESGGKEEFSGSPEQLIWLIEKSSNVEAGIALANKFLQDLLKGRSSDLNSPEVPGSWSQPPNELAEKRDAGGSNSWGIFGAHRGSSEWTLAGSLSQSDALKLWRGLEESGAGDSVRQDRNFQLSGAHVGAVDASSLLPLLDLFVWHRRIAINDRVEVSLTEADDDEIHVDQSVTMRLVLVETMADKWIEIVRSSLLQDQEVGVSQASASQYTDEVSKLSSDTARDTSVIAVYLAFAHYRYGDRSKAVTILTDAFQKLSSQSKSMKADTIYFASTSALMAQDAAQDRR